LPEIPLVVRHEAGLHARPLAQFVKTAKAFDAQVLVRNLTTGTGPADGKSTLSLLLLSVQSGHEIAINASGPQADEALAALQLLVERDFEAT